MTTWKLVGLRTITVEVPHDYEENRVRFPYLIYSAAFWDRLLNRNIQVYRNGKLMFNWPARRMEPPETKA